MSGVNGRCSVTGDHARTAAAADNRPGPVVNADVDRAEIFGFAACGLHTDGVIAVQVNCSSGNIGDFAVAFVKQAERII